MEDAVPSLMALFAILCSPEHAAASMGEHFYNSLSDKGVWLIMSLGIAEVPSNS